MDQSLPFQRSLSNNVHSPPLLQHVSASHCAPSDSTPKPKPYWQLTEHYTCLSDAKQTAASLIYHTPVQVTTGASMPHPLWTHQTEQNSGRCWPCHPCVLDFGPHLIHKQEQSLSGFCCLPRKIKMEITCSELKEKCCWGRFMFKNRKKY